MSGKLDHVGNIHLQRIIGQGETAEVYLGVHRSLNRPVAVKIIHSHLSESRELVARFKQEAEAIAGLRHPNIVYIHDYSVVEGRPCIVMEYLRGVSLAQLIEQLGRSAKRMPPRAAAAVARKLTDALAYAHERGIIHRDVKPANIILRSKTAEIAAGRELPEDIEPVLMDFGVAHLMNTSIRTGTGTFMGTPAYMSPEQILGEPVDGRTDIYSFGVVFYEMLTGGLPFDSRTDTPTSVFYKHVHVEFPPLPAEVDSFQPILDRCLAKDRYQRYASAKELEADLGRFPLPSIGSRPIDSFLTRTLIDFHGLRKRILGQNVPDAGEAIEEETPIGLTLPKVNSTYPNWGLLRAELVPSGAGGEHASARRSRKLYVAFGVMALALGAIAGAFAFADGRWLGSSSNGSDRQASSNSNPGANGQASGIEAAGQTPTVGDLNATAAGAAESGTESVAAATYLTPTPTPQSTFASTGLSPGGSGTPGATSTKPFSTASPGPSSTPNPSSTTAPTTTSPPPTNTSPPPTATPILPIPTLPLPTLPIPTLPSIP